MRPSLPRCGISFAFLVISVFLSTAATAGLKEATMLVPVELADVAPLKVSGRQGWRRFERLQFGDFLVHDVQRSLTQGGNLRILAYEGTKGRQTFGFALSEQGKKTWIGECETTLRRRALDVGVGVEFQSKSGFGARLRSAADPAQDGFSGSMKPAKGRCRARCSTATWS